MIIDGAGRYLIPGLWDMHVHAFWTRDHPERMLPGRFADLVLLEADPLDDISNTARIAAVISNGRVFTHQDLDGLLAAVQAAVTRPIE